MQDLARRGLSEVQLKLRPELVRLTAGTVDATQSVEGAESLLRHRIRAIGIPEATFGYLVARWRSDVTLLLACTEGEGQVYVNGQFRPLCAGMFYLAPHGAAQGYRATQRTPWRLSFVEFEESEGHPPLLSCAESVTTVGEPRPIEAAVGAFLREANGPAEAMLLERYADIVYLEAQRTMRDFRRADRLWPVWQAVAVDPGRAWNLPMLAREAGLSPEQLRVICVRETGRTPMRQVAHLRMQRAATILSTSDTKLEVVADSVGYGSSFAFCAAFKREMGVSPGAYRAKRSDHPPRDG